MDITKYKPNVLLVTLPITKDFYHNRRKVLSVQKLNVTITLNDRGKPEQYPVYIAVHETDHYGAAFMAFICLDGNQLEF